MHQDRTEARSGTETDVSADSDAKPQGSKQSERGEPGIPTLIRSDLLPSLGSRSASQPFSTSAIRDDSQILNNAIDWGPNDGPGALLTIAAKQPSVKDPYSSASNATQALLSLTERLLEVWSREMQPGESIPPDLRSAANELTARLDLDQVRDRGGRSESGGDAAVEASDADTEDAAGMAMMHRANWFIEVKEVPGIGMMRHVSLIVWVNTEVPPQLMQTQVSSAEPVRRVSQPFEWAGEIMVDISAENHTVEMVSWRFGPAASATGTAAAADGRSNQEEGDDWRVLNTKQYFTPAHILPADPRPSTTSPGGQTSPFATVPAPTAAPVANAKRNEHLLTRGVDSQDEARTWRNTHRPQGLGSGIQGSQVCAWGGVQP